MDHAGNEKQARGRWLNAVMMAMNDGSGLKFSHTDPRAAFPERNRSEGGGGRHDGRQRHLNIAFARATCPLAKSAPNRNPVAPSLYSDMNPDIDPDDPPALRQACAVNGFQCLKIEKIVEEVQVLPNEYRFEVQFGAPEGGTFLLTSCCRFTEAAQPPRSEFEYTVTRLANSDNAFRVQGLPVYVA